MSYGSVMSNDGDYSQDQKRILGYLKDGVQRGKQYFKSKQIAEATDLSPKQVGVHLGILKEKTQDLEIEKWGYSTSTTWRVSQSSG